MLSVGEAVVSGGVAGFFEGFAVFLSFCEVLRGFDRLIAESIVAEVSVVRCIL